ncbi:class I SAM-dependent methyltransferase [Paenibacillus sp. MBLB4367]|uniref:class I SAM-dependent methyltransferase n=1 Tax=Paenibacillus sp. MBLB4367 TaxID=3384767 RepID=UPI0039083D94
MAESYEESRVDMSKWFTTYYDALMKPLEQRALHPIRQKLLAQAAGNVIEIGSGTGVNFRYYANAGKVFAVEPEPSMLERSLERVRLSDIPIETVLARAESLPFPADSFDTAVGTLVLCTIPDPLVALAEIRRVCRPGATVLLLEHVKVDHPVWGALQSKLTPAWKRLCGGCHLDRNTLDSVKRAGFRVRRAERKYKGLLLMIEAENDKPV